MYPIRVLHIVGNSKFGGASRIVVELATMAKSQGWSPAILASDPQYAEFIVENGIDLVPLDVAHREIRPWRDLQDLWRLRHFLKSHAYTIVHTHTSKGGFLGRLAAWSSGVPVVIHTAHGFAIHEDSPWHQRVAYSVIERLAAMWCTSVVCVSEFHRDWAISLGIARAEKVGAIPNGIDADRVMTLRRRDLCREALGVADGEFLIVSHGRLAKQKGLEYLVAAMRSLVERGARQVRLILAGDGPLRGALEEMIASYGLSSHVSLIGFREDIGEVLRAADLVVLPSEREGLSISVLEALAAGRPMVLSSIGSNREIASRGNAAILVPPRNAEAIAEAVTRCMAEPQRLAQMGASAREVFDRFYAKRRMLAEYARLYEQLLTAAGLEPSKARAIGASA